MKLIIKKCSHFFMKAIKWFFVVIFIIGFAISIKTFLAEAYAIPSESMESSILSGDYLIVNKIVYGPKWPQSPMEISFFNLLALNSQLRPWFQNTKWPYKRWPNGNIISRDDIVVFEGPWKNKKNLIKRCKGLPGELIELRKDRLLVNGKPIKEPETIKYIYISSKTANNIYGVTGLQLRQDLVSSNFFEPRNEYKLLPTTAEKINRKFETKVLEVSSYESRKDNNYGPVLIPRKGATINLYKYIHEIKPYKQAIKKFEGALIEISGSNILINGQPDSLFTFKNDYYFMMGDNRHSSLDSRVWGFIPKRHIIGKASLIWFSKDKLNGKVRWNRTFKKIK